MSAEKPGGRRRRQRAVTTPVSSTDPIKTLTLADKLTFEHIPTRKAAFAVYALPAGVTIRIEYRLINNDGSTGKRGSFPYSGPLKASDDLPVTAEEYEGTASVEVWASPYGYAALHGGGEGEDKLGQGRLTFTYKPLPKRQNGRRTTWFESRIFQSVVIFIVNAMNQNKASELIVDCHRLNTEAIVLEAQASVANAGAGPLHPEQYAVALALEAAAKVKRLQALVAFKEVVATHSIWDQKDIIGVVWGQLNRLGDSDDVYFYDIWSNIHFAYIGRAAGFSLSMLHFGSDLQNIRDHWRSDDDTDRTAIDAGFELYDAGRDVTIEEMLATLRRNPRWRKSERPT